MTKSRFTPAAKGWRSLSRALLRALPFGLLLTASAAATAQDTVEWRHLGGDADHAGCCVEQRAAQQLGQ